MLIINTKKFTFLFLQTTVRGTFSQSMASPFESSSLNRTQGKPKISFGQIKLKKAEDDDGDGDGGEEGTGPFPAVGGFSSFSFSRPSSSTLDPGTRKAEGAVGVDEVEMNRVMGFSTFDTSKKEVKQKKSARNFDVKEMTEAIRKSKLREREDLALTESQTIILNPDEDHDETGEDEEEHESKPKLKSVDEDEDREGGTLGSSTSKTDAYDEDEDLSS
jgi:hypothetical protein